MNSETKEKIKLAMLDLLKSGGEYTREQLAMLVTPSDQVYVDWNKVRALAIELDLEDRVTVRLAGDGTAYYSKRKRSLEMGGRVRFPTVFSKGGAV